MKKIILSISAVILAFGLSSCVGDLDVTPIDPAMNTADKALTSADDYFSLMAQCYAGFSHSGSYGPNGNNNISGIDGGFSQYFRGRYHLNGLTTDEAVCGWNDQTLQDLHGFGWTTSDVFVAAFYYRVFYQISACNEFIRQANKASIDLPEKDRWIAEVRALRAFCWLDAIDNYGNVPFADENNAIGELPKRITRADLFSYIEKECQELLEGSDLFEIAASPYGRANKGLVTMILAKLYLNAEVYTGTPKYQECVNVLKTLDGAYSLHDNFQELFLADNNNCTDELIFTIEQDGNDVQSYGVTNYLIFACTGGAMDAAAMGISSGWGGLRTTRQMYEKFSDDDARKLFWTEGHNIDIEKISEFSEGYAMMKFKNVNSDGSPAKANGFVDVDFPVFRYADALLMKAECELRGATGADGLASYNLVRGRAGLPVASSYTLQDVLDERGRELLLEGWRRSDLIRFGKFTGNDYLWAWKGGVQAGKGVPSYMNLFPIPENDLNSNPNLSQNDGYPTK